MKLEGVHHVTAITGDAPRNVDFYTRVLGLRLVAKSVNQDDPTVYHLFYSDEEGHAGSDITFFEYPGAVPGRPGAGMVHTVIWRVSGEDSLAFWAARLTAEGVAVERGRAGADSRVGFSDPEGLAHELVVPSAPDEPLTADHPEIPAEHALQGFDGVRAYSAAPERSAPLLEGVLGARVLDGDAWELRGEGGGATIASAPPRTEPGRQSAGSVPHVGGGTTVAEHPGWAERLAEAGVQNPGVIDRHYFHSIYFREPSGVLFEIADDGPGFTVDSPVEELGRRIILPPRLEPHREQLESVLTPLPAPRADWPTRA